MTADRHPLTVKDLAAMKQRGEKIACLTAYDASFAAVLDRVGIDAILVGDSLGMTMQGHATTLPVTVADVAYHARCVSRVRQRALVIADMPFMSYPTPETAAENAAQLIRSGGAQMVKLEGAKNQIVQFLVAQGIPVCGHLGLLPQFINQIGRYSLQGREPEAAAKIEAEALALQEAGASALVLECVPAKLAQAISQRLHIPVIGIGAGGHCDGQVLVLQDMLGFGLGTPPRFVKNFLAATGSVEAAIAAYHLAVKQREFPAMEQPV